MNEFFLDTEKISVEQKFMLMLHQRIEDTEEKNKKLEDKIKKQLYIPNKCSQEFNKVRNFFRKKQDEIRKLKYSQTVESYLFIYKDKIPKHLLDKMNDHEIITVGKILDIISKSKNNLDKFISSFNAECLLESLEIYNDDVATWIKNEIETFLNYKIEKNFIDYTELRQKN